MSISSNLNLSETINSLETNQFISTNPQKRSKKERKKGLRFKKFYISSNIEVMHLNKKQNFFSSFSEFHYYFQNNKMKSFISLPCTHMGINILYVGLSSQTILQITVKQLKK